MKKIIYVFLILLIIFAYKIYQNPKISKYSYQPINIKALPIQINKEKLPTVYIGEDFKDFNITPVAEYNINALVVSKKNYLPISWADKMAPLDLALAWGTIIDYIDDISFSQGGRWYYYKYNTNNDVLSISEISSNSSNNHIIPANENIKKAIFDIKTGIKIHLEGYLVNINGTYNGNPVWWNTSLSRDDTGAGSCEIFYVNKVFYNKKIFE